MQPLLDREAIRDCIYRCCRGIDRADEDALRSAYWPDAVCRHAGHQGSGAEFIEWVLPRLKAGGRSNHLIGNILIEQHGDSAAAESYFRTIVGGHDASGAAQETLLAGRYVDRFERRSGQWRIAVRTVVYDWIRQTLLTHEMDDAAFGARLPAGGHKPHDPLYALLAHPSFTRGTAAHS
jgi:ketosteroid isomerase-like protein